jgi:23S rRNA (uracil1939-C5)-methyltransferase
MEPLEIEFDTMTPLGLAAGPLPPPAQRIALAWGALPGERASVFPLRRRKGALLCRVEEILKASPDRVPAREPHYLSCSPWQVMSYPAQLDAKRKILGELFPGVAPAPFVHAETVWGYRNKLEFSFTTDDGRLQLAFHQRGSPFRKVVLPDGCALAPDSMNRAAIELLDRLAARGVAERDLKSLVVRGSRTTGEALLGLYVSDEALAARIAAPEWLLDPPLAHSAGLAVFYSDPLSPASVATRLLLRSGRQELTERVAGVDLSFPLEGFFQNHAEVFERAVAAIASQVPAGEQLVELYSGVGSIGLALAGSAREIVAFEENPAAVEFALLNRDHLGAANYLPRAGRAQDVEDELLAGAGVLVVDPPRSGLHPKLVGGIARARPARLIYLSCNPANQARDLALLGPAYRLASLTGFDFYPQTPHLESLAVLDRV